jgi:RND family efflux transporter MFP subunit
MKPSIRSKRLAVAVAGALLLMGAAALVGRSPSAKTAPASPVPSLTVSLLNANNESFLRTVSATGSVNARDELLIGSDASGLRLMEVLVDVGSAVRKGQLLARADDAQLQTQLAQQLAQIKNAEAELVQARANFERAQQLTDYYSVETVQTRRTQAATAAAKLELAVAQRDELLVRIAHTRVVAPSSGIIAKRSATVGAVVQQGAELFRLIRDGELEWRAELPSHSLAQIEAGALARVLLDSGEWLEARVRMVAPTMDSATRNGLVYVALPRSTSLKAGAHARGEIILASAQALSLPDASVLTRDGNAYVYTVGSDNIARLTRITTGARQRGRVEVTAGLKPEDRVVGAGAGFLKDGDLVGVSKS